MSWNLTNKFYNNYIQAFHPHDLDKDEVLNEIKDKKYHIYLICKRKKLHFSACDVSNPNHNTSIFYYLDDQHDKKFIKKQHEKDVVISKSVAKGYVIVITNGEAWEVRDFVIINLLFKLANAYTDGPDDFLPSDLEVLYIGQAFGRKADKKIDYRLVHHEKVQKIALKILDEASSEDVIVLSVCIECGDMAAGIFGLEDLQIITNDSLLSLRDKARQRISEGQQITIYEAGLIRYFQPKYNKEYKISFPSCDFSSYDEIYATDFDLIDIHLDTYPVAARVWSEEINKPRYIHHCLYPLKTSHEKKSLFEFLFDSSKDK